MNENYDEAYRQVDLFGTESSPLLPRFSDRLAGKSTVLDIGIGQGRNSWPLAAAGFQVTGIDPSLMAVQTVNRLSGEKNLPLTAIQTGFEDFHPEKSFDVVLCFGLMQILDPEGVKALVSGCRRWLAPAGLLLLTAWHVGDLLAGLCLRLPSDDRLDVVTRNIRAILSAKQVFQQDTQ